MKNTVEEIMKTYENALKQIDSEYKNNLKLKENEDKEQKKVEEEIKKGPLFSEINEMNLEIRHQENDIQKIIDILNNEQISAFEKNEYNKILNEKQESIKKLKASKEQKENENELKIQELKNNQNKKADKQDDMSLEKSRDIQKMEKKDTIIKALTKEKSNIAVEIEKRRLLLDSKTLAIKEFEYEYYEKDGVRVPKKESGEKFEKLLRRKEEIEKELLELAEFDKQCDKYLEELKQPSKDVINFNKALHGKYGDPTKAEPVEQEPAEQNPVEEEPVEEEPIEQEPVEEEPIEQEPIEQEPVEEEPIEQEPVEEEPIEQEPLEPLLKIAVGKETKIVIGDIVYLVDENTLKNSLNLTEEQKEELLNEYIITDEDNLLVKELIGRRQFDISVLYALDRSKIPSYDTKRQIAKKYINKCMSPKEEDSIAIEYNVDSLSKVNLFKRLFKKELNNKEKFNILLNAKEAEKNDIASVKGEYKVNWLEKVFSKFTKEKRPLALPTKAEIEAAYEYNENLYGKKGKEFKESLEAARHTMNSWDSYQELKSLAKSQKFNDTIHKNNQKEDNSNER